MADPSWDTQGDAMKTAEYVGRQSPSSSVCYHKDDDGDAQRDAQGNSDASPQTRGRSGNMQASPATNKSDNTSQSERYRSDNPTAPPTFQSTLHGSSSDTPSEGYFSPKPLRPFSAHLPGSAASTGDLPTHSTSLMNTNTNSNRRQSYTPASQPEPPLDHRERLFAQRDLSTLFSADAGTVRAHEAHDVTPGASQSANRRISRDFPHFPNQSYAALHHQYHPPPYVPHVLRTRSSNPAPHHSYSISGSALSGRSQDDFRNLRELGSKTAGTSPASSPGLYTPTSSPLRTGFVEDQHGAYASPYLHFTHRQIPKETHKADVDVDPISGRKLINQYEVIDELGRGVHGKVKLGRNLDNGEHVAIKIVDRFSKKKRLGKSGSHEDKIKKEIAILKKARHPNIVSLLEVIDDPEKKKVYIILEHVQMGEVQWRTEGAKEISLIEYRRFQRERRGIFENDAAVLEDEQILAEAERRREQKEHRKSRNLRQQRAEESDGGWSLEYAAQSEREESDNESKVQASVTPNTAISSEHHVNEADHELDSPSHIHMPTDSDINDRTPPYEIRNYLTAESTLSWEDRTPQPEPANFHTGLEGTMYGAYDTDSPRDRTPSVHSLASSRNMDVVDINAVPEHFRFVPTMTLTDARNSFRDTVLGLEYLHYQGVIHRDIKPANLLQAKDRHIKISDFGVSYLGRGSGEDYGDQSESEANDEEEAVELAKTVGTPAFYAPELCQTDCESETPPVTGQIDVWSLGVTLYCLVYGRVPFYANNTFALMRRIAEEEAYIPNHRLKAVDVKVGSRASSQGRMFDAISSSKRRPYELIYEEVDDVLHDLLRRLLIRDPTRRIKLTEVKHHPWVLGDIPNPTAWLDDTDPSRQTQGRRIEVTKEEMNDAVAPLNIVERAIAGIRKGLTNLGIGRSRSTRRGRAQSSTTSLDQPPSSGASSSTTISQDARRTSLRPDDHIVAALRASRDGEHPLSQSLTASPELRDHREFFLGPDSRPESPVGELHKMPSRLRPTVPDRAYSTLSSTGSIRTIRQSDVASILGPTPSTHPALPSTPIATPLPPETQGTSLGGIFGGASRKILKTVRSRERNSGDHTGSERAKSIDRVAGPDDPRAGPSIGISNAVAAGRVDAPPLPLETSSASPAASLPSSRAPSVASGEHLLPISAGPSLSRDSSVSSIVSSRGRMAAGTDERFQFPANLEHSPYPVGTSDERFSRARDELMRRRILEQEQNRERASSSNARPTSSLSQEACPPSPDDEIFYQKQMQEAATRHRHTYDIDNGEPMSTVDRIGPPKPITASSSEDHFTSGLSQSTSNPSIPSIMSADSSIVPDDGVYGEQEPPKVMQWPAGTVNPPLTEEDDTGYAGDAAVESGDDGDESDDSFIEMSRKKPNRRSESASNAIIARQRARRETGNSVKSTRSGSNNTMKKVRSHSHSDTEGNRHIDKVQSG